MAQSVVQIWNIALRRMKHAPVASEDEESEEAAVLRESWDLNLDLFLESYDWEFARRYGALTPIADELELVDAWTVAYEMPENDLLVFRGLINPTGPSGEHVPYTTALRLGSNDMKILTDLGDAQGVWTVRITDVSRFPASFTQVMAFALQADLEAAFSKSENRVRRAEALLMRAHDHAKVATAEQAEPRKTMSTTPNSIAARA